MQIRTSVADKKAADPILPIRSRNRDVPNPSARTAARIPPRIRPKLNIIAVSPTPRSLRALLVQLNQEAWDMASPIIDNATTGAAMPQIPAILSNEPIVDIEGRKVINPSG